MRLINVCCFVFNRAKLYVLFKKSKNSYQLFLINGMIQHVSDHSQCVFVDVFDVVV